MKRSRNYTVPIAIISIVLIGAILLLTYLPGYEGEVGFDVKILPLMNAIFNTFTFLFLLLALIAIKKKNVNTHRKFIFAAFSTTTLFLFTYVAHHILSEPTSHGGPDWVRYIYLLVLLTHIVLAAAIVPLALITVVRGLNMDVERHRKIARWTMPLWLYVSATGVIVYLMISPYY